MKIIERINKVSRSIGKVHKDGKNPHFKSSYMTLSGIREALDPILDENDLMIFQYTHMDNDKLVLTTEVSSITEAGQTIRSSLLLIGTDMQKLGSAITYARRYSIVTMFGILDTDDDGEYSMNRTGDIAMAAKQQQLIKLLGDDIKLAVEIKSKLNITNNVNEMTGAELDAMIAEARRV